ncbi:ethanolamine utilization acetate kinase EutQ [Noviherbaspirillum saxi]|uniref:Ethanolamine utilization acetate kinase EutQ n=1 Tax=Noviherbaspirillum saxi TaxID=2320863 RepID=A0A3A3FHS5_9BURK|nr:ethanolamine utilization acetate kinase EutQ [Noviherbaspirillum saxi]RJF92064.1 ethanolamine utilization acetate kinase EutQ [Noviherbaspirillum saxi]
MKHLISAQVVRSEHAAGRTRIAASRTTSIVTPEALTVAARLGVEFIDAVPTSPAHADTASIASTVSNGGAANKTAVALAVATDDDLHAKVRAQVLAKLPPGIVSEAVVGQLVDKVMKEGRATAKAVQPTNEKTAHYTFQKTAGGIKRVDGQSIHFGKLDEVSTGDSIGIADVVNTADGSPMAAGFMAWSECFFPWTLSYDEIDVVLEGELHIRCEGQEVICRAGDVVFIPKGSVIEFGTPTSTRFLYVTYPADWQAK